MDSKFSIIMEAAKKEFAANGYANTTVEMITKAAGVAKGTFYLYFKKKEEVLELMIMEVFRRINTVLDEYVEKIKNDNSNFRDLLKEMFFNSIREFFEMKDIIRTSSYSIFNVTPEIQKMKETVDANLQKKIENFLLISKEKKHLRINDCETFSRLLFNMAQYISLELINPENREKSLEYYADIIEDFLFNGIFVN